MTKPTKVYLAGNIMGYGDNLARQEEYDKLMAAHLNLDVYSPVLNKSINDKASMTEEENNCLAEKITEADIERLWNSDVVVVEPRQDAVGTLCEVGCLYGWHYMARKLIMTYQNALNNDKDMTIAFSEMCDEILRIYEKANYFHYFDIRTNHLNEKDWRRSFSINQLLYGMILDCAQDKQLNNKFDDVLEKLVKRYKESSDE